MLGRLAWFTVAAFAVGTMAPFSLSRCSTTEKQPPDPLELAPAPRPAENNQIDSVTMSTWYLPSREFAVEEVNGVEWSVRVRIVEDRKPREDRICFTWTIKYVGRRPPLTILEPSLERRTGQTRAIFYAFYRDAKIGRRVEVAAQKPRYFNFVMTGDPDEYPFPYNWFLIIKSGDHFTGQTFVPLSTLRHLLAGRYPAEYSKDATPTLYIQLIHEPDERGESYNLDSWTGKLQSPFMKLEAGWPW